MKTDYYRGIIRKLGLSIHDYYDLTGGNMVWLRVKIMSFLRTGVFPDFSKFDATAQKYAKDMICALMRAAGENEEYIRAVVLGRKVFKLPFARKYNQYSMDESDYDYNCKLFGYDYKKWDTRNLTADVVWAFFEDGFYYEVTRNEKKQPINRDIIRSIMQQDGADEETINKVFAGHPYVFKKQLRRFPSMQLFYYPEFETNC